MFWVCCNLFFYNQHSVRQSDSYDSPFSLWSLSYFFACHLSHSTHIYSHSFSDPFYQGKICPKVIPINVTVHWNVFCHWNHCYSLYSRPFTTHEISHIPITTVLGVPHTFSGKWFWPPHYFACCACPELSQSIVFFKVLVIVYWMVIQPITVKLSDQFRTNALDKVAVLWEDMDFHMRVWGSEFTKLTNRLDLTIIYEHVKFGGTVV